MERMEGLRRYRLEALLFSGKPAIAAQTCHSVRYLCALMGVGECKSNYALLNGSH